MTLFDDPALTPEQNAFMNRSVLDRHVTMFRNAFTGTASPRAAIKTFCMNCAGNDLETAKSCMVTICPLWQYNGYRTGHKMGRAAPALSEGEDSACGIDESQLTLDV